MHALTKDSWRHKSCTGKLTPETIKTAGYGGVALYNVLYTHVTLWTDLHRDGPTLPVKKRETVQHKYNVTSS